MEQTSQPIATQPFEYPNEPPNLNLPLDLGPAPAVDQSQAILAWLQGALAPKTPKAPVGPSVEEVARRVVREELRKLFGELAGHFEVRTSAPVQVVEPGLKLAPAIAETEPANGVLALPAVAKRGPGRPKKVKADKPEVEVKATAAKKRNGTNLLALPDGLRKGQLTIGMAAHQFKIDTKDLYQAIKRGDLVPNEVPGRGRGVRNGLIKVLRESDLKAWMAKN